MRQRRACQAVRGPPEADRDVVGGARGAGCADQGAPAAQRGSEPPAESDAVDAADSEGAWRDAATVPA